MPLGCATRGAVVRCIAAAALAAALAAPGAAAQTPTTQELIQRLSPAPPPPPGTPEFRGITVKRPAADPAVPPGPAKPPSVDLSVNFEFNSARLSADSELILDNLGRALNDPALKGSRFLIGGHTDAVGSQAYNQRLSEQRAAAVRDYLIAHYHVGADRLEAHGYGFARLLDTADPKNAVNRRVEVTNLGTATQ